MQDRNQIIVQATEYLDRHGDELPLLEVYILLVIPAYQGSTLLYTLFIRILVHSTTGCVKVGECLTVQRRKRGDSYLDQASAFRLFLAAQGELIRVLHPSSTHSLHCFT